MIPSQPVNVSADLPTNAQFWTPRPSDITEDGFGFFHDVWALPRAGVRVTRRLLEIEARGVAVVAELAETAEAFDRLATVLEGSEVDEADEQDELSDRERARFAELRNDARLWPDSPLMGLELGVAGLVYALSSAWMFPAASCRGHVGPPAPWSDVPVVEFAVDERRALLLQPLVEAASAGFSIDAGRPELLSIHAPSIEATMKLAGLIDAQRAAFRPLPRRAAAPSRRALRAAAAAAQLDLF